MGGKTKTEQKSNSTQTVAPPSWTMPGIQAISDKVNAAANQPVPEYTGDFFAGANYNPAIAAYTGAATRAGGLTDYLDSTMRNFQAIKPEFQMSSLPSFSAYTPANTDEQMRSAIGSEANAVTRAFMQQVMPGIRSSALDAGAYSGDRASAILPQLAMDDATRNIGEIASKYVYQNANANADRALSAWDSENNRMLGAFNADTERGLGAGQLGASQQQQFMAQLPDLVQSIMQMATGQGDILQTAAGLDQQQRQQGIDNALAQHTYDVQRPYEGLDLATALLTQLSGNYGTTNNKGQSTTTQTTGGLGSVVQGLAGIAGMAAGFPGGGGMLSSLFKPKAAAAGGSIPSTVFPM